MTQNWKAVERAIADLLRMRRVPVSGRQRGSAPDIEQDPDRADSPGWLSIEIKHRKSVPEWLLDAMDQAVASIRGKQIPFVIIHQKGQPYGEALVVTQAKHMSELSQ